MFGYHGTKATLAEMKSWCSWHDYKFVEKVKNNTWKAVNKVNGDNVLVLHGHVIAAWNDKAMTLYSCGYETYTTADRIDWLMNRWCGNAAQRLAHKGRWYIWAAWMKRPADHTKPWDWRDQVVSDFFDGVQIDRHGNVLNPQGPSGLPRHGAPRRQPNIKFEIIL